MNTQPKALRILIVEDMQELAKLLRENLLFYGFEVETAYDGAAALELLKTKTFDVALLDIELTGVSGFEVVVRGRTAGLLRNTRIVFCTGGCLEEHSSWAREFSGSDIIAKPFIINKFLSKIADVKHSQLAQGECGTTTLSSMDFL